MKRPRIFSLILLVAVTSLFAFAPGCAKPGASSTNMEESISPPLPADPDTPTETPLEQ